MFVWINITVSIIVLDYHISGYRCFSGSDLNLIFAMYLQVLMIVVTSYCH